MSRTALVVLVAAIVVSLAVAGTALSQSAAAPKLNGTTGPAFKITLTKGGKKVTSLKPGAYSFVIADKSTIHDFTLEQKTGGKYEKHLTAIPFQGNKTVKVTLKKGKYKYYCSAHEPQMFGFFTVK